MLEDYRQAEQQITYTQYFPVHDESTQGDASVMVCRCYCLHERQHDGFYVQH